MLTKEQLSCIRYVPNESDIDIKTILEFYNEYLLPYKFMYHLQDGLCIKLQFHKSNFCHLLGLHYIESKTTKHDPYERTNGYNKIMREGLSMQKLESINKFQYCYNKNRILYFPFILQLLQNPNVIEFDKTKISKCTVQCDIILYDEYHNVNIHLGISGNTKYFYPVTFLVEPIGNTYKGDRLIYKQKTMKISRIQIEPRMKEEIV